ncbi:hypothetical protein [Viridibacterium curvum]|uniref:Secreted protein n=1 Tax=Viridibacterium curvum TaxID=1101404 RepID=A0ABP9R5F8_9RHOO
MDSSLTHFVAYPLAIVSLAFLYLRVLLECWLHGRAEQQSAARRQMRDQTHSHWVPAFAGTTASGAISHHRHSREGGNPVSSEASQSRWVPAFSLSPIPSPASGRGERRAALPVLKLAGTTDEGGVHG